MGQDLFGVVVVALVPPVVVAALAFGVGNGGLLW